MTEGRAGERDRAVPVPPGLGSQPLGAFRGSLALLGAAFIHLLIRLFGRVVRPEQAPWLLGPVGGATIGDAAYDEVAREEGLTVERGAREGGLLPDFDVLASPDFDAARTLASVRRFYEHTARHRMDLWAEAYFPGSIGLWLLVTVLSRKVDQLNFPLRMLDSAQGMESEIVHLRARDGRPRYTGWYRRLVSSGRVLYTGFYLTERVPRRAGPVVKVVFPMPGGNATVLLAPRNAPDGSFVLDSGGEGFGDVGFYRVHRLREGRLRVWYVRTLKERFRLYEDGRGVLRCDHEVRFLGMRVLSLHYRIEEHAAR